MRQRELWITLIIAGRFLSTHKCMWRGEWKCEHNLRAAAPPRPGLVFSRFNYICWWLMRPRGSADPNNTLAINHFSLAGRSIQCISGIQHLRTINIVSIPSGWKLLVSLFCYPGLKRAFLQSRDSQSVRHEPVVSGFLTIDKIVYLVGTLGTTNSLQNAFCVRIKEFVFQYVFIIKPRCRIENCVFLLWL